MTQTTLWPTEEPVEALQTRTKGLRFQEAEKASQGRYNLRKSNWPTGAYLYPKDGRWIYHSSTGEEREDWTPGLVEATRSNWEIIPKEVQAA